MRIPLSVTHARTPPRTARTAHAVAHRSQEFRDRLYVLVVAGLVLATVALVVGYAVHELPRWRSGQLGGFDTVVLPTPDQSAGDAAVTEPGVAGTGIDRTTLLIVSMLIEAAIFVGLGLYLRHEMKGKS